MRRFLILLGLHFFCFECRGDTAFIGGRTSNMGGSGGGTTLELINSLTVGDSSASFVSIFGDPEGQVNVIGVSLDGTIIFGGDNGFTSTPLISRLSPGSSTCTTIATPPGQLGGILCVAVASDGTAILGGQDGDGKPLVYKLAPSSSTVTQLTLPSAD